MEQIPLANTFKVIAFPTVQSWLHCFNAICLIFWENKGNNFYTMSMWILSEKNICKGTILGFWYLFSPFPVLSSQSRNGIPHKAEKKIDMAINIYIFSLPFHCKIIIEQISYKHLGMKWWTKPTRARCHGDYIWNTENFFIYTFIFVIDIIWISSLLQQHPYSQKSYTSYN